MAEYIVDTTEGIYNARTIGEIVRCRDCKNFVDVMGQTECERSSGEYFGVEPDGFCAWAEPKEES